MIDHAPYIHAVARVLGDAGFWVRSVGGHDWKPRGGHILLGCQDGWERYDWGDADVRWNERDGWTCEWGGITDSLGVRRIETPNRVAVAVANVVGQTPAHVGTPFRGVDAEPGTAEFDAALAAYQPETTR